MKKNRRVVADNVVVAFLRVELEGKPAKIAVGVGRTFFAANGGEACQRRRPTANLTKDMRLGIGTHVSGGFEVAQGPSTLSVHHAFRNAFARERRKLLDQLKVLQ